MNKNIQLEVSKIEVESYVDHKISVSLEEVDVGQIVSEVGELDILYKIDEDKIIDFVREDLGLEVTEKSD